MAVVPDLRFDADGFSLYEDAGHAVPHVDSRIIYGDDVQVEAGVRMYLWRTASTTLLVVRDKPSRKRTAQTELGSSRTSFVR